MKNDYRQLEKMAEELKDKRGEIDIRRKRNVLEAA